MGFNKIEKEIIKLINKGKIFDFPSFVKHYYSDSKVSLTKCKIESILMKKINQEMFDEISTKLDNDELLCNEDLTPEDMPEGASCFMGGYKYRAFTHFEKEQIKKLLQYPEIPKGRYKIKVNFDTPVEVDLMDNDIYLIKDTIYLKYFRNVIQSLKKQELGIFSVMQPKEDTALCCFKVLKVKPNKQSSPFYSLDKYIKKNYIFNYFYGNDKYISDNESIVINTSLIEESKDIMKIKIESDYSLDDFVNNNYIIFDVYSYKKTRSLSIISISISFIALIATISQIIYQIFFSLPSK